MRILPPPAPETPEQLAFAAQGLRRRVGMPLLATAVMLTVLLGIVLIPAVRSIPAPPGLDPGIGRGLLMQIPIAITVLFLTFRLAGFANVGLQARGAWSSIALSAPI